MEKLLNLIIDTFTYIYFIFLKKIPMKLILFVQTLKRLLKVGNLSNYFKNILTIFQSKFLILGSTIFIFHYWIM